jgi:cyclophilin family peptidyl-prolyl cis-trans isomerase
MKTSNHAWRLGALAALSLLLLPATPARAEAPKLEISSEPAKAEVALGDDISIEVTVKNAGTTDATLPELTFDARSVSFEVTYEGGKVAWDTQFHTDPPKSSMEPDPLHALKMGTLKAGESWKEKFTIPAIAAGSWSIVSIYSGASDPMPRGLNAFRAVGRLNMLKDAAKTIKVLPGAGGETEVQAKIATTMGTFAMRFHPKDALGSALNFVRIVQSGYYEGKSFHRIDDGIDIIQGGAPRSDGGGNFPYTIPRELGLKHDPWSVGMARSGDPNSGGSQFYISFGPKTQTLDRPDGYAVFAHVVKGKDVIEALASVKTKGGPGAGAQMPTTPLNIETAKIELGPRPQE